LWRPDDGPERPKHVGGGFNKKVNCARVGVIIAGLII
jgi:hypothetical protein